MPTMSINYIEKRKRKPNNTDTGKHLIAKEITNVIPTWPGSTV